MGMKGLTGHEVLGKGAGLEGGREGVPIGSRVPPRLHLRVKLQGFQWHLVADEADDHGVPHGGGGAWKAVQKMASQLRLPLLA